MHPSVNTSVGKRFLINELFIIQRIVEKYGLKNEATSNVKIKEIPNELDIPAGVYMRDDKFSIKLGIVSVYPQ